jgi:hypothetical protein
VCQSVCFERYFNAKTRFSYPPPAFYDWGECVRVYVFNGGSVQTVPHPFFENVTVQCENTFVASTTCFFMSEESVSVYMF